MSDIIPVAILAQFLNPAAKHLSEQALEEAQRLSARATAMLNAVGRTPRYVSPKLLVPLVQAASLETDPTLADHWAALLANAADPKQKQKPLPSFPEILRQLTTTEAMLLTAIAAFPPEYLSTDERTAFFWATYSYKHINNASKEEFEIAIENLVRLGLCVTRGPEPPVAIQQALGGKSHGADEALPGKERIAISYLGWAFFNAVTAPIS
jgi:hypothetical protein